MCVKEYWDLNIPGYYPGPIVEKLFDKDKIYVVGRMNPGYEDSEIVLSSNGIELEFAIWDYAVDYMFVHIREYNLKELIN